MTRLMHQRSRQTQGEEGFFTIWVLGLCVCILLVGGLGVDLWRGFAERRDMAAMADAAAIAGASQLDLEAFGQTPSVLRLDPALARQRATEYLAAEASKSGFEFTAVDIGVDEETIEVSVSRELDLSLTKILVPQEAITVNAIGAAEARVAE
jgi:hypothetical protein